MPPDPETDQPRQSASGTPDATDSPATTETIGEASPSPSSRESEVEEAYNYWQKDWQKPPAPPDDGDSGLEDGEPPDLRKMSFLDHLEELRSRLFYCLISVVVGFLVCWTFADDIYAGLARPLTGTLRELGMDDHLVYTNPVAPFQLYVHMAFLGSLFVAAPFILYQVWRFIAPGLYPHERRYAVPFVFLCSGLFMAGGAFAYYAAFPAALRFLLTFGGQFRPMITVNEYFSLATTIILGMALVFELPILLLFLTLLRVMTPRFLLRNFRYAVLLIFILAAAITPTPDVPTMMLFAMPLIGLYLFGVGLSYVVLRLRARGREA
jgi:sec-independent protein translocase protein TatC